MVLNTLAVHNDIGSLVATKCGRLAVQMTLIYVYSAVGLPQAIEVVLAVAVVVIFSPHDVQL